MPSATISTTDVRKAKAELDRMRRSLSRWLEFRAKGDAVLAGAGKTRKDPGYARAVIASARADNLAAEQRLASHLSVLLGEVMPEVTLPEPTSPGAAVVLAQIAISGQPPMVTTSPSAQAGAHPWLWPVLIVGGLLLAVTTAIRSAADVALQKEQNACIEAGACTDSAFWLRAAAVVGIGWFVWKELGVGQIVRGHLAARAHPSQRSSRR